jgi:ubiquinone/menaquinone biosynthesis C-methylase UbiE
MSITLPAFGLQGDAMALPFDDCSFDAATMGYGLRNVADRPAALRVGWQSPASF